jgi:O-Antigen ligase
MAGAVALAVYLPLLTAACVLVWRSPVLALYAFIVGLALHNAVMAALFAHGVDGAALDSIQAWKEILLVTAAASVGLDALRERRLPFRPGPVDALALAFAAVVVVYALVPQDVLGGDAGLRGIALAARHALLPVGAYLVGRSLRLGTAELRRIGWTVLGTAASLSAIGLVEEWTLSVQWWRDSGVPRYFREQLGFDYHGPGGMPENFAFNSEDGVFRRLISTFLSPLATGFMLVVALLLAGADGLRRRVALPLAALCAVAFLFTLSRSSVLALAGGLAVLAIALRRPWPVAGAAATVAVGVVFASVFTSLAPRTHFLPEDLPYQEQEARARGALPAGEGVIDPGEPSIRSHLTNLRDGLEKVVRHPQGYGLGNAGAVAQRTGTELKAGESNYTELGVEIGLAGLILFVAWSLALLVGLVRAARRTAPGLHWAAAWLAASLAAVLALGIQTDALGVPWLAYCVWWLGGSLLASGAQGPDRLPVAVDDPAAGEVVGRELDRDPVAG